MKSNRHRKILEIIEERDNETQEELADALRNAGFDVTQATVSRDIKNLKLVKIQNPSGKYRYEAPKEKTVNLTDKLTNVLSNATVSVEHIDKMVIVKTFTGAASAVAEAIDSFGFSEIAGTVAGDNTIFIMVRTIESAEEIVNRINKLIS